MAMGEATGTAAALALDKQDNIRNVDAMLLRSRLAGGGALLEPGPEKIPASGS